MNKNNKNRQRRSRDIYFSCDIEADGPIPGEYSMSSIGLCATGIYDGKTFEEIDVEKHTFYAELKPISDKFDPEAAAVSGIPRETLIAKGETPEEAMERLDNWVRKIAKEYNAMPVFAAYPLGFDWMFAYWYMRNYADSPFSFSRCIDIKTLYSAKFNSPISTSTKRFMPKRLFTSRRHTHNALDDAQGQGELLQAIMNS